MLDLLPNVWLTDLEFGQEDVILGDASAMRVEHGHPATILERGLQLVHAHAEGVPARGRIGGDLEAVAVRHYFAGDPIVVAQQPAARTEVPLSPTVFPVPKVDEHPVARGYGLEHLPIHCQRNVVAWLELGSLQAVPQDSEMIPKPEVRGMLDRSHHVRAGNAGDDVVPVGVAIKDGNPILQ